MPLLFRYVRNRLINPFSFYAPNKGTTRGIEMNSSEGRVTAVIRMPAAAEALAGKLDYIKR